MSLILSISSLVVSVLIAVRLWPGASCLCHHLVSDASPQQKNKPYAPHFNLSLFRYLLIFLFFASLFIKSDILAVRLVLHQQNICRPLPSSRSRGNTGQGYQQGEKEELITQLHTHTHNSIHLTSQPAADGHRKTAATYFVTATTDIYEPSLDQAAF